MKPDLITTFRAIKESKPANWFLKMYQDKLERKVSDFRYFHGLGNLTDEQLLGCIDLFQDVKLTSWQLRSIRSATELAMKDGEISQKRREILAQIQELCKEKEPWVDGP
jgi:hypothetical protein